MDITTPIRRSCAVALAACAVLTVISVVLMPAFAGDYADRLRGIAAAPTASWVSALLFTVAQLPFAIGLAGVAGWTVRSAPVLSVIAGSLAVLGGFGHAVHGGVSMLMITMADDPAHYDTYATALAAAESGTLVPFMAAGLLGTVFGLIMTAVALWRAKVRPRWLPAVLVAFVLVEFVGGNLSDWSVYLSGALYLVGLVLLAVVLWRTPAPSRGEKHSVEPVAVAV